MRSSSSELTWSIAGHVDVISLQVASRSFAARHGCERRRQWSVAIIASELATNMLKYAGGGLMVLRWLESPRLLEVEARDRGPGFTDIAIAQRDHVSEGVDLRAEPGPTAGRRGLGTGLGAVQRLADSVVVENLPEGGGRVVARVTAGPLGEG